MEQQNRDYKKEFIEIFERDIQREGADKLLEWLKKSDFFYAPASTRFHSAHLGGLCEHSVKTYYRFLQNLEMEYSEEMEEKISLESIAIIALLHDVCKVNTYKTDYRNVKEDGNWVQKPYYTTEDNLPYGHGEKSVYIITGFMRLSREEAMAINWHMGGFDDRVRGGSYTVGVAFQEYPLAVLTHTADFLATYLDEKREKEEDV